MLARLSPYPGGVGSGSREGLQRREVRVLALNSLSSSWAVVDALHNLGSYQGTCMEGEPTENHTPYSSISTKYLY